MSRELIVKVKDGLKIPAWLYEESVMEAQSAGQTFDGFVWSALIEHLAKLHGQRHIQDRQAIHRNNLQPARVYTPLGHDPDLEV